MAAPMICCRAIKRQNLSSFSHRFWRYFSTIAANKSCARTSEFSGSLSSKCYFPRLTSFSDHLRPYSQDITTTNEEEDDALYKKLTVEVRGHDPEVLKSYETYVSTTAKLLDINLVNVDTPKKVIEKRTLLKSVHIYKKHRVQYEMRTHFKIFNIKHITGSTADAFLEYIQRNLPEGMSMKVTRHRIEPLPDHIKPPETQPEISS